ncbi:MAG: gp264 [uncultured marine phage]|uniref:Gp264 n=1 Tax=uncultured marine phage TaxID=707152 RepID=A0A8D9CD05_9VIRU|nr:MAG: gp264 [uncultured marine phage]
MAAQNSFATVASQVVNYNSNILELLSKLDSVSTSNQSSIPIDFTDEFGVLSTYNVPSLGYLLGEIQRLNNNINTLFSIDTNGALIQNADNKYKKVITVDLNIEPNTINDLDTVTSFVATKNWFFDALLNPMLSIEIDLEDRVEDNVRKAFVRRYIVEFNKTSDGELTTLGQSAQNSFNDTFRGKANISLEDFEYWHATTPGVENPQNATYDEQMFDLQPNEVLYDGIFSVLKIEEDTLNRKLWYHLDTLDYIVTETTEAQQLAEGDEVIINEPLSTTRYKVIEVSTASSNPRVRLERVMGLEPVPVITGALKIYSPLVYNKIVRVSIGYDERNVVFVKPMNADNHLLAKDWSLGTGYWSNDLNLVSNDDDNGKTMEQFYQEKVYDYGKVLQDLVDKNIPSNLAAVPSIPELLEDNFKVVQVNKHLTDTPDSQTLAVKHNAQVKFKAELTQLGEAIVSKTKELKTTKFASKSAKKSFNNELQQLSLKKASKSKLLKTTVDEIISLSSNVVNKKITPKYKVRGFWEMPDPALVRGSKPQEVVQFKIEYRYLSKDGKENPVESFKIKKSDDTLAENAAYSNWIPVLTDARKRIKDESTNTYYWEIQDVADADTPNINQLEISINPNEKVEIRIKSLSEVGFPDSPVESPWSEVLEIEFPDDLNNVLGDNEFILREATQEELKVRLDNELEAKGLDTHLSEMIVIGEKNYNHTTDSILTEIKDDTSGLQLSLFEYINKLEERLTSLEEAVNRSKGVLSVYIIRDDEEFSVNNNEEVTFNVECEDYLDDYSGNGVPNGRVFANNVYIVKDFAVRVENTASSSTLGLLSNRTYFTNSDLLRTDAPQVFWANERDELLSNTSTGNTRTQLDNQFFWISNYVSVDNTTVVKLSENIGNDFQTDNSNSLTAVLSQTEYNAGYSENTILDFLNNNNSILEMEKWVDTSVSVASNTKLLTTVHPVVQNLEDLVETNSDKVKSIDPGLDSAIQIPVNIYFKMNALDPNAGVGNNYDYINLNNSTTTTRHIKKVRFFLENEAENRPFIFTIKFNINRNKVGIQKITANPKLVKSARIR